MNRNFTAVLAPLALLGFGLAQDFSAEVVYVTPSAKGQAATASPARHEPSKLYVSKGKMRLETNGLTGTVLLVDNEAHETVALFPTQKAFQPLASAPSLYFRVDDAENACADWQNHSDRKLDCEKAGHETLDGRDTVKYKNKAVTPASPVSAIWIDPTLNFVIKWEDPDGGAELRKITKEENLVSTLFEVPKGYDQMRPKKKGPKSGAGPKGGASAR